MPRTPRFVRRLFGAALAALMAAPVVAGAVSGPAQAAGTPLFPDLKTLPPRELRFDRADITADLSGVFDNVLRFSNDTYNAGEGPLVLNATINPTTLSGPSTQRVMNTDGTFTDYPLNNDIYWHAAHHHYHFDHWGDYQLWTKATYDAWIASGRTTGAPIYSGAKTTSCVTDEEFVANVPNAVYPGQYGAGGCDVNSQQQIHMGLAPGWGDTYDWYRQLQWIDLGQNTLGNGTYVLRSVADPLNIIYESANKADTARESVQDNETSTTFVVAGGAIQDSDPPTGTITINQTNKTTSSANVSVAVVGRDDVSEPNQFRLSNDGITWKTFSYTSSGSDPTTAAWNLADTTTGGSTANGIRTVYAQVHDISGKWGPTITDTIDLENGGGGGPPPPPPPPPTGPYAQVVVGDSPAGYWRLNEASGTTANDSIGASPGTYQNGVTLGAPSLLASDPDPAATFSGTSQSVLVPSTGTISPATAMSLEAWIKPTSLPAAGAFRSVATKNNSYSLQFNGPRLEFTIMQGGTKRRLQAPAGAIVAGNKYHVVGTYDGTTQKLYVNGALSASAALTGAITVNTTAFDIGSWDGASEFFNGTLDEVAVYSHILSPTQVANHYSAGISTAPPPVQSQLSISRSGAGSGTVTSVPAGINCGATCSAGFNNGTSITLTATPLAGSTFGGWTGGGCSGTAPCTFTSSTNTSVDAAFAPVPTNTLTVSKSGAGTGTVTSSPAGVNCGTTCTGTFNTGTSITLTPTPVAGSTFTGWTGACSGTSPCVLALNADAAATAAFATAPVSSYQQVVTADAPVGYWRLNETSGTSAANTAVATSPGTYTGVTLGAPGLLGSASNKAATFSGTNSRVQVASTPALSPTAKVSVEAWIKPTALPAAGAFASVASKAESYSLQFNGPRMEFTIIQGSTRRRLQAPVGAVAVGGTYHVVGTYDGATQRLYINGASVASVALTGAIGANTNALYIGSWNGSSEFFNGTVDEVAVYSNALTATQVANHRTAGTTVTVALVTGGPSIQLLARSVAGTRSSVRVGGTTPVATAFDSGLHRAYVTRTVGRGLAARNGVTVIDTRTWRPVEQVSTGGSGPGSIAVNPVTHLVYVTTAVFDPDGVHGSVTVIDGRTNKVVHSIATGPGPKAVAVNAKTNRVYVTEQTGTDGGAAIAVINGASGKVVATIPIGSYERYYDNPFGLAVNSKTNTVYASNPLEGTVYTVNGRSNAVIRSVALGGEPTALAVNPATNTVYVTCARNVTAISGSSGAVTRSLAIGRSRGVAVDASRGLVFATTSHGDLLAINARTLRSPNLVAHGAMPYGIAFDDTTGKLAVADPFRSNISVYSPTPLEPA